MRNHNEALATIWRRGDSPVGALVPSQRPWTSRHWLSLWFLLALFVYEPFTLMAVEAVRVGSGFHRPIYVTSPPGDSDRLFVLEQFAAGSTTTATVKILDLNNCDDNGHCATNPTPFLTVTDLETNAADVDFQGTAGMTFHPDYANNGRLYVSFIGPNQDTHVREYRVSESSPDVADPDPLRTIITVEKIRGSRHNATWLGFGPNDGYLYLTTGDNVVFANGQDLNNLNAKVLRIDVDGDDEFPNDPLRNYAIPESNPFANAAGADEIWAYGLRNPWRASFDRATGDFYIGDVGEGAREEINAQPASYPGGLNYGWVAREGTIPTPGLGGPLGGATDPIYEYAHGVGANQGFSVTGGYVYRGPITAMLGEYFFADFTNERIWSLRYDGSDPSTHDGTNFNTFVDRTNELQSGGTSINQIVSFGEDGAGNLYLVDYSGEIFQLTLIAVDQVPGSWIVPSSGNWHDANNWLNQEIPNSNAQLAIFGRAIDDDRTVVTDIDVTLQAVTFDNPNSYVIMGSGAIHFEAESGNAELTVLQGHHQFQSEVNFLSDAVAEVRGGASITFNNQVNLNGQTVTKTGDGKLIVNHHLSTDGGSLMLTAGAVSGAGVIAGDVANLLGTLSPGNSPGEIVILGDYTQGPGGSLLIELAGTTAAQQHDQLQVTGMASLAGELEVVLLDRYEPSAGDAFTIFDFDSVNGSFDTLLLPELASGLAWETTALYGSGTLAVVPEPSAIVMLLLGTLWFWRLTDARTLAALRAILWL